MMRLIDADALKDGLIDYQQKHTDSLGDDYWIVENVLLHIEEMPTIDAEPVRHGHFIFTHKPNIYGGITIKCSECGYEGVIAHIEDHHYCWVCGAKMDMEEE